MTDALGWRTKFAVVAPSTNTIVQPDFDDMRPVGVTNHFGRITVPNMPLRNDEDFIALMGLIEGELYHAVDRCMSCEQDHLLMGMSSAMFWDGFEPSEKRRQALERHCGVKVTAGSFAVQAALQVFGVSRIAVISPYQPIADRQVTKFFTDCGFEVVRLTGLKCPSPVAIAEVGEAALRRHIGAIDGDDVEAIVQIGTNLPMTRLAAAATLWLGKPVIAINTATYWQALRARGIDDKIAGFGPLLAEH